MKIVQIGSFSGPHFPVFGLNTEIYAKKVSKYEVFPGPYVPIFGLNTEIVFSPNLGKYGPEKTPYLDTFHAVCPQYS